MKSGGEPTASEEARPRIPPGQYLTQKWPVLHCGSIPAADLETWRFRVWGEIERPFSCSWSEFQELPRTAIRTDIHCVTRWSRLDAEFEGVSLRHVLELVRPRPGARYVLAHAEQGYTANLPLQALAHDDVLLCDVADGAPLTPEHGFPLRLVVPGRYFWKSPKWIRGLQFLTHDQPGFWERYGYHDGADPWREERFADDQG